ncbi:MAG: exonuclease domain-containing protein [bacterium]
MQLQLSLAVADRLYETLLVRGEPLDAVEAARLLIASPNAPVALCNAILAALVHHDQRFCWGSAPSGIPLSGDPTLAALEGVRRVSLRHWEAPDPDLADVPFVALDLETTGARAGASKITEIGAVRLEGFREAKHFSTLVNPMRPIPRMITQITGITQEMVADAPRIEDVIPALLEFLEGAVVVAHNAPFDVGFLNYELRRLKGRQLGDGAIDTLPMARALAPGLPNYRLHTVAEALGAPVAACHRALADAQAAGHVFVTLVGRLQEQGITRLGEARSYVSPSSRSAVEKLRLTRDVPRAPGTYRFVDKDGRILYVGKADRLHERVRSYFVANAGHSRKVRQAVRLVERVDWDETCTPLEAVVREQQLILEHRPPCNLHGGRPERYAYVKAGGSGLGLNLYLSCQAPKWLARLEFEAEPTQSGRTRARVPKSSQSRRQALTLGPFRGRARLSAALDLLHRCYPVRRCPRRPDGRPCVRGEGGRCLAPCTGDPQALAAHDSLVMELIGWLTGGSLANLPDPLDRAQEAMRGLSRQRRYEEAQALRDACGHLLSIRRSYRSLAEAHQLCFAALWPHAGNGDGALVRMNLVWNGRLRQPVSLHPPLLEQEIGAALAPLWDRSASPSEPSAAPPFVAVPQKELDSLMAVRRWFREADQTVRVLLPGPSADHERLQALKAQLLSEARSVLLLEPAARGEAGSAI